MTQFVCTTTVPTGASNRHTAAAGVAQQFIRALLYGQYFMECRGYTLKLKHDAIAIAGEVCHGFLMYMRQMLHVAFHTTHSVCCRLTLTVLAVSQLTPAVFNASAVTYSGVSC
eukprot:14516-Heterococcus_DN1.PRE.2